MRRSAKSPATTLAIACVAAFMTSVDIMVVTTALPTLRAHFRGSVGQLEWTMNAYNLAFACLLLTAAALGDRFGRRRILSLGLIIFGAASAIAAVSTSLDSLIAARAFQGIGAALILPLTLTVISEAYPPETRGRAIGVWGAGLGLGGVLGPIVGAVALDLLGWRGIFWINVPVAAVAAPLAWTVIRETFGPDSPIDVVGVLLVTSGCLGIAWGLVRSTSASFSSPEVLAPSAAGVVVLAGFVGWERRTRTPMMPTAMFKTRSFSAANVVSLCVYASLAGGVFLMSQFFQTAQHDTPTGAALRFIPWPLPSLIVAPIAGALAARFGNRPFLVAGMAAQTAGLAWFAHLAHADTSYLRLLAPLVVSGIGIALVFPTVAGEVMSSVPSARMGVASGANATIRELGGVLGVALAATTFAHNGGYGSARSFATGFSGALWGCAVVSGLGFIAAMFAYGETRTMATAPSLAD